MVDKYTADKVVRVVFKFNGDRPVPRDVTRIEYTLRDWFRPKSIQIQSLIDGIGQRVTVIGPVEDLHDVAKQLPDNPRPIIDESKRTITLEFPVR